MANDSSSTHSDCDGVNQLLPTPEPPRLRNVNAIKLWLDLNELLQEYDLESVTDLSELNSRLDWKDVRTLQNLNTKQRAERYRVREQVELARYSGEAKSDSNDGTSG